MRVRRLSWVGTRTGKFDETLDFFGGVLGLTLVREEPGFAMFSLPSGDHDYVEVFGLDDPEVPFMTTGPVPGLLVDDVAQARQELEAAGIELLEPIRWLNAEVMGRIAEQVRRGLRDAAMAGRGAIGHRGERATDRQRPNRRDCQRSRDQRVEIHRQRMQHFRRGARAGQCGVEGTGVAERVAAKQHPSADDCGECIAMAQRTAIARPEKIPERSTAGSGDLRKRLSDTAGLPGNNVLGEGLESNPAVLLNSNGHVASLAGLDIPDRAGLAGVRAAHHLTIVTVSQAHSTAMLHRSANWFPSGSVNSASHNSDFGVRFTR
mgnify:CR=1 FL=1